MLYIYISILKSSHAKISFINVYAKLLRDGTKKYVCVRAERWRWNSYGAVCHNTKALEDLYRGRLGRYPSIQPLGSVFTRNLPSTYILKASSLKRRKRPFPPIRSFTPPLSFTSTRETWTRGSPVLSEIRNPRRYSAVARVTKIYSDA